MISIDGLNLLRLRTFLLECQNWSAWTSSNAHDNKSSDQLTKAEDKHNGQW